GAPNGNYYKGTIELAPNLPFKGIIPIKNMLEMLLLNEGWNLKVTITNDANAAGIGEMIYGAAKGVNDFIMITLGTGVGSAIVSNGKMIYGHDGFAGEVGHTIVEIDGRECGCGRKGCLETYSSATGIRRTALSLLKQENSPSILREIEEKDINGYTICKAARKNDALALKCIDLTARMLAIGVANAVAVTSPKKIIFSGGLSKAGDLLLTPFKAYLEENLYPVFRGKIEVELSALEENNTAILGAAALNY
ncbi:MAG: ROK family protein, partial [Bacteroidales bacterium]|nr:ROK family protein [Bacteroidales bacterium]